MKKINPLLSDPFLRTKFHRNAKALHNLPVPTLYENALQPPSNPYTHQTLITNTGALLAYSGTKTGRSPTDKRIVCDN